MQSPPTDDERARHNCNDASSEAERQFVWMEIRAEARGVPQSCFLVGHTRLCRARLFQTGA